MSDTFDADDGAVNPRGGAFGSSDADDGLEKLIRLADPGAEVPTDGAARMKRHLEPLWRRQVRVRRRRRGVLWLGGGLAAAATLAMAISLSIRSGGDDSRPGDIVGRVAVVSGSLELVEVGRLAEQARLVGPGTVVTEGARLRTAGDGRAAVALSGGSSLRLDRGSEVRLESPRQIALDRGAVYVDAAGTGLAITTTEGVVRDIGTQFEVRQEPAAVTVRVREGRVAITGRPEPVEVADRTAVVLAGDEVTSRPIDSFGPDWSWVQQVAPPLDIEGATVASFLIWVSRETGFRLEYGDAEIERRAAEITLHGSIDGLTPREAVEVVLPSTGLEAVTRKGRLHIASAVASQS